MQDHVFSEKEICKHPSHMYSKALHHIAYTVNSDFKAWSPLLTQLQYCHLRKGKWQLTQGTDNSSGSSISWWVLTDQTGMASMAGSIINSMLFHGKCNSIWDTISYYLQSYVSNLQYASNGILGHNDMPQQNGKPPCFHQKNILSAQQKHFQH